MCDQESDGPILLTTWTSRSTADEEYCIWESTVSKYWSYIILAVLKRLYQVFMHELNGSDVDEWCFGKDRGFSRFR